MPPKKEPTPRAFLVWLKEAASRLAQTKPWPKGATRFGYFKSEVCWNLRPDLEGHEDRLTFNMEDYESAYKTAHESGDTNAIFEFAKDNREALSRDWVISQLVKWRLSDSAKGKRQFDRFMLVYWTRQGNRTRKTILGIIRRDQRVYKAFVGRDRVLSMKVALSDLSDRYIMSPDSVKDVLKYYGQFYNRWKNSRNTRLYLSLKP